MTLQIRRSAGSRVTRENRPRRAFVMSVHGYSQSQKLLCILGAKFITNINDNSFIVICEEDNINCVIFFFISGM